MALGEGDLLHSMGAHACVRVHAAAQPTDLHLKGASASPGCLLSSVGSDVQFVKWSKREAGVAEDWGCSS